MLAGPQVFVDIDTQVDFLDPAGALFVPGSTEIVPNLARLTRFARERGIPILASADAHTPDDPELATFPPHCMVGEPGQERIAATAPPHSLIFDEVTPLPSTVPSHLTVLKHQFSLCSHPRSDQLLSLYLADRPIFVVYGVATDYCVRAAVDGFLARGGRVALVVDAIRSIDQDAESRILTGYAGQGVLLTVTEVICDANQIVSVSLPAGPPSW
jgi:nicotinamidase/pyrazinamidase